MNGPRSKATPEEIREAFHTDEGFKAVAKRLGMSPNTLRPLWKAEFGEEAYKVRGKTLQARAAAKTARSIAKNRVYKDVLVSCTSCDSTVVLKSNQAAHMDLSTFICESCRCDRECPVCGLAVDGIRGLSTHFRHRREAKDDAHILYEHRSEIVRWLGQVEGVDYVSCLECGHRGLSLNRHIGTVRKIGTFCAHWATKKLGDAQ